MRPSGIRLHDPRLRAIAALLAAFTFSALDHPLALLLMVCLTAVILASSGVSPRDLARRMRLPGIVIALLVLMLAFTSGTTPAFSIGPLTVRYEGALAAASIATRFLCIMSVATVWIGTLGPDKLVAALRGLKAPALIVDMTMLSLRHIDELRHDLRRTRTAMALRGAPEGFWRGQFQAGGWAIASLLLRSHARSDRIYHAMILRGHGSPSAARPEFDRPARAEIGLLLALFAVLIALLALDRA